MPKTVTIRYEIGEDSVSYNFKVTNYLSHEDETIISDYDHEGLLSVDSEVFKSVLKDLTGKNLILEKLEQPGDVLVRLSPDGVWFKGKEADFSNLEGVENYIVSIASAVNHFISLKGFSESTTFTI
jgi:transposase